MVCSSGGRTSSLKMAGLLLLLMTLATFGSCYLTDAGDSSPHNLARRDGPVACTDAMPEWKPAKFKTCRGELISIAGGKRSIDLSTWSDDELAIFATKQFRGGFIIQNSQKIVGKEVFITMFLDAGNNQNIIVANNAKLEEIYLETLHNTFPPYVRVSGNRILNEETIQSLNNLLAKKKIQPNSYIQVHGEYDLGNVTVTNVATTLAGCAAIYGDLILDSNTIFPSNEAGWKNITKLAYVQGCLRITGTKLTSWKNLTFLDGTTSKGGCTTGHEITGNLEMCIHPPLAEELKKNFAGIKIEKNKKCTPECTSRHVLEKADSTCVIITDSLVIDATTTQKGLAALANVEEIRGLLQVSKTHITNFTYLPKLTKLNSKNISVGPVITIQLNTKLASFDLPQLQASGLGTGRAEQIKFWTDKNGPEEKYDGDEDFLRRIGAENSRVVVPRNLARTMSTTTVATVTAAKPKGIAEVGKLNLKTILPAGAVLPLILSLVGLGVVVYRSGWMTKAKTWKTQPMKEPAEQTDIYQYHQKNEFIQMARKIIEENKPKIEAANLRHRNNRDYKLISILNHMTTRIMPGRFQLKDYEQNKDLRVKQIYDEVEDICMLKLPAEINGQYGLAFDKAIGGKYPAEFKYRTQCDQYPVIWFFNKLKPIYEEKFASTAKRMCHKPCDVISENLRYLRNNSIKIPEFGITTRGFQMETGMWGKLHGSRLAEEKEDLIWMKDQIPVYKFHRYRQKMNELETSDTLMKFLVSGGDNLDQFVIRMVKMMMSMPVGHVLNLTASDVLHFLRVLFPTVVGKAVGFDAIYNRSAMSAGEYSVPLNRTHVRIVGELRGDFDALRRAINIPSLLEGKEHPMLQYNWVFLGNYTGRHPQSLETIMFLLSLQFLYGRDCIVLLRGIMEFADTSEEYGFKENLKKRFGKYKGKKMWENFMKVFARLPLNCLVLRAVYCCSGGFNDGDDVGKDKEAPTGRFTQKTTRQSLNKIFSLPNYTVRDYFENADTGAGYYYGERALDRLSREKGWYTFFTTGPMTGGVGYFGDTALAQLFMLSSVKNLHGHGGMVTQVAAVAELNGQTGRVTFHMILEEDQMVYYDTQQMELRNTPFEQEEDGQSKKRKKTKITSTASGTTSATEAATTTGGPASATGAPTGETTTPAGNKTASSKTPNV